MLHSYVDKYILAFINYGDKTMLELTIEQEKTIEISFKAEHLKDEIKLAKEFDDYDFDDE